MKWLADVDAAADELGAGRLDVEDDHAQYMERERVEKGKAE